jgi:DNA repair protein RadC
VSVLERSGLIKTPPACLIAELLAVMLQTGATGRTSLDIARDMLSRYGGLVGFLAADRASLTENPEIGAAKAARFVAMKELSQLHMLGGHKVQAYLDQLGGNSRLPACKI